LKNIDLHIHTTASDGTLSPSQVVAEARRAGLALLEDPVQGLLARLARRLESG
jgi:hypothetical protein